jgi:putative Ca2+/H+ antiporter (TMEM165/GDT1 family)
MEIFFASTLLVAVAEIGDKTMLLAILLATRFKKPLAIIAGIFAATMANHALAAWAGSALASVFMSDTFRIAVAIGFILMAAWTLIPDKVDDDMKVASQRGAFVATTIAFFLVEMGDKTQVATIALGAQYHAVLVVAAGTTLGMMIANVPAVYLGEKLVEKVSLRIVHRIAASMFLFLGLWQLWELSNPA